jgi:hypothetical protein
MPFPISSILFRREAVEAVSGFDEALAREIPLLVDDLDLVSRIAREGPVLGVPEVLGAFRIHSASVSARLFATQRMGMRFIAQRRLAEAEGRGLTWKMFEASYRPSRNDLRRDRVAASYRSAGLAVAEGRWLTALGGGLIAAILGPRYTFSRLLRQRPWKRGLNT